VYTLGTDALLFVVIIADFGQFPSRHVKILGNKRGSYRVVGKLTKVRNKSILFFQQKLINQSKRNMIRFRAGLSVRSLNSSFIHSHVINNQSARLIASRQDVRSTCFGRQKIVILKRFASNGRSEQLTSKEIEHYTRNPLEDEVDTDEVIKDGTETILTAPRQLKMPEDFGREIDVLPIVPRFLEYLSHYVPVEQGYIVLNHVHDLGLPWWGVVFSLACVMKAINIPLVNAARRNQESVNQMEFMPELIKEINNSKPGEKSKEEERLRKLMYENGYRGYKNFLPLSTIPLSLFIATLLRYIFYTKGIHGEGLFWFKDLAALDHWWGLPLISNGMAIASFKMSMSHGSNRVGILATILKKVVPPLFLLTIPFIQVLPQGVLFYISSACLLQFVQSIWNYRRAVINKKKMEQVKME